MKKLFLLTTVASLAAFPVLAQEATEPTTITPPAEQTAPAQETDQAPAPDVTQQDPAAEPADPNAPATDMTQEEPATDPNAPATETTQQEPTTDPAAPATAETEQPATPPPSEAVIPAQAADQVRAERMIGMDVYDTNGDKVGQVKDILFGQDGKATGIVLSVGGVLGLGAKQVGLQWSEVDIQPDAEVAKVQYNKQQLEAAPDFKTQEAQKAESEAAQMQMQQESAPTTGTQ